MLCTRGLVLKTCLVFFKFQSSANTKQFKDLYYTCGICDLSFITQNNLMRHVYENHYKEGNDNPAEGIKNINKNCSKKRKNQNSKKDTRNCKYCRKEIKPKGHWMHEQACEKKSSNNTTKTATNVTEKTEENITKPPIPLVQAEKKKMKRKPNKTGFDPEQEKKRRCQKCGKAFSLSYLKIHEKYFHSDVKVYKCDMCEYSGPRLDYVKRHKLAKHKIA